MELDKCSCYLSIWDFQDDGYAFTIDPEEIESQIEVNDLQGKSKRIDLLPSDKSQKLLGVMRNPMGNQQDEIEQLKTKSNAIATKININAITSVQAKMAYESFYLPAMRYSLPITSINQMDFESIQQRATLSFLSTMGYNRHMPREVVFATPKFQGIGLKHLYDLQGVDSLKLFFQEINHSGIIGDMLSYLLEVIQMEAGIGSPIMEDNRPLIYIEWGWIPSIRDFLFHINAKIKNASTPPPTFRQNDSYIMDTRILPRLTRKEQILINRCRLHLQVECVSDIANAEGNAILEEWFHGKRKKSSRSLKRWPLQEDPGKEAWKIWKKFLYGFLTNNLLTKKLGAWTTQNTQQLHQAYYHPETTTLWIPSVHTNWTSHAILQARRRNKTFRRDADRNTATPPQGIIPIDIVGKTDLTYITGCASFYCTTV
jgi:hypothetical protein